MGGNYTGWSLVPAVLQLVAGDHLLELKIATLGFNRRIARDLLKLIDAGRIENGSLICSSFYRSHDQDVYAWIAAELSARGFDVACTRCHAKVLLMHTSADHWLVVEGSANLRSCNNIEQFALFNDREVYQFHAGWMQEVLAAA